MAGERWLTFMEAIDGPNLPELTLRPSRRRLLVLLIVAASFTAVGALMIRGGDQRGWFVLSVPGIAAIVPFLILVLPGASYLRLAPEGFTICSLYRKSFIRWSEVTGFQLTTVALKTLVGFDYAPKFQRSPRLRRLSAAISGCQGALPDTYGLRALELATVMAIYRKRAIGEVAT